MTDQLEIDARAKVEWHKDHTEVAETFLAFRLSLERQIERRVMRRLPRDLGEPVKLYLPPNMRAKPEASTVEYSGSPGESIPDMLRAVRDDLGSTVPLPASDTVKILAPPGGYNAFVLETDDKGGHRIGMNWLGEATLIIEGAGGVNSSRGSKMRPSRGKSGSTITLNTLRSYRERQVPGSDPSWAGRVVIDGFYLPCSKRDMLSTVGGMERAPYRNVTIQNCTWVDHPDPLVQPKWGINSYQAALSVINCRMDLYNVTEHTIYEHQPCGDSVFAGNWSGASGSNFIQSTSRPSEGPSYGRTKAYLLSNRITNWGIWPQRASNAITIGGSDRDWDIGNNWIWMEDGIAHNGGKALGCIVIWDDTQTASGTPQANGKIRLAGNLIGGVNQDRNCIDVQNCESFEAWDDFIFGNPLNIETKGVLDWTVRGCNGPAQLARLRAAGAPAYVESLISMLRLDDDPSTDKRLVAAPFNAREPGE